VLALLKKQTLNIQQHQYWILSLVVICSFFCWHACLTVHIVMTHIYVFVFFLTFSPAPVSRFVPFFSSSLTVSMKFGHQAASVV
jgi:hypothetical protein